MLSEEAKGILELLDWSSDQSQGETERQTHALCDGAWLSVQGIDDQDAVEEAYSFLKGENHGSIR